MRAKSNNSHLETHLKPEYGATERVNREEEALPVSIHPVSLDGLLGDPCELMLGNRGKEANLGA